MIQELLHINAGTGLTNLSQYYNKNEIFELAVDNARVSKDHGDEPTGAVLVKEGEVIASSRNRVRELNDPIAVAEMDCIRQAGRRSDHRKLTLYTTRYPDMLVAGTLVQFSVGRIAIGMPPTSSEPVTFLQENNIEVEFVDIPVPAGAGTVIVNE